MTLKHLVLALAVAAACAVAPSSPRGSTEAVGDTFEMSLAKAVAKDDATLAVVQNPNDLATIEYFLDRNRLSFWIGLKKITTATYCVNKDCNGKLE